MSRVSAAPGTSIRAQVREAKAAIRRALRLEIRDLETKLKEKKDQLRQLELERNGRKILERGEATISVPVETPHIIQK